MIAVTPGQRITITDEVRDPFSDPPDQLVDDASETIVVWRPNGVVFSPTPIAQHVSPGLYRFTFVVPTGAVYPDPSVYGTWSARTESSNQAEGVGEIVEFLVEPLPG